MLAELVKGLQVILEFLRKEAPPKRRRGKLAKSILKIYIDTHEIVMRGRRILSCLEAKGPVAPSEAVTDLILKQQLAIADVVERFSAPEVKTVLGLYTDVRGLTHLLEFKYCSLSSRVRPRLLPDRLIDDSERVNTLRGPSAPERRSSDRLIDDRELEKLENTLEKLENWNTFTHVSFEELYDPLPSMDDRRLLEEIDQLLAEIRKVLLEKFELNDFI